MSIAVLAASLASFAAAPALDGLPAELLPWVPFVAARHPDLPCPQVAGEPVCVWPGRLDLSVDAAGGRFSMELHADRAATLRLPGGAGAWPLDVRVDGAAAAVVEQGGRPAAAVPPGHHRVEGRFSWPALPQSLAVPGSVALVGLQVDGAAVPAPVRDADGTLRLGAGGAREADRLDLDVLRAVRDGVPAVVESRFVLRVAGGSREVDLGAALPANTRAVAIEAELPARVDASGRLTVQVRPGTFTVTVQALHDGPLQSITAPENPSPGWPAQEYWVVEADDAVRAVTLDGPAAVDPARTPLPDAWRALPAFLVAPAESLRLTELRRGAPEAPPNDLRLSREIWVDADGAGYTIRDHFTGTLHQGWRLDAAAPLTLGSAEVDGAGQVLTTAGGGAAGVELRSVALNLQAVGRVDGRPAVLPAVGWSTEVQGLDARLHLPTGWSLLAVFGADDAAGSLVSAWTPWDGILLLLAAAVLAKRGGLRLAVLGVAALGLTRGLPGAPGLSFLALAAAGLAVDALAAGRFGAWASRARLALLGLVALGVLPWATERALEAIAPSGAPRGGDGFLSTADRMVMAEPTPNVAPAAPPPMDEGMAIALGGEAAVGAPQEQKAAPAPIQDGGSSGESASLSSSFRRGRGDYASPSKKAALQVDPNAIVQTGPGVPEPTGRVATLSWIGPVQPGHEIRLVLLPPAGTRALAFLQAALTAALLAALAGLRWPRAASPVAAGPLAVALALALLPARPAAAAPAAELLAELERRLTAPPACAPACVTVAHTKVEAVRAEGGRDRLRLTLELHAAADTAAPLPGPADGWSPSSVRLDGAPIAALVRRPDGFVWARLDAGVHRLELEGPLTDGLTLQLPSPVMALDLRAPGWSVQGQRADGTVDRALAFVRTAPAEAGGGAEPAPSRLAPWVTVTRELDLGIPWSVRTVVERRGTATEPLTLQVPLLPGESVVDAAWEVANGAVRVTLDAESPVATWDSTLATADRLALQAPAGVPWSERWVLRCSTVFACAADTALPPLRHTDGTAAATTWLPWPGEAVTLTVTRPAAASGATLTVDAATHTIRPGPRISSHTLDLRLRSSQGGQHAVRLPAGARLRAVTVDGRALPLPLDAGAVNLPVRPGTTTAQVEWQEDLGLSLLYRPSQPDLGAAGVNARVAVRFDAGPRWVLWSTGPLDGPTPLRWFSLAFLLVAAAAQARAGLLLLPARLAAPLLLGLGLFLGDAALLALPALGALAWRARPVDRGPLTHNALQLVAFAAVAALALLVTVAGGIGLMDQPAMDLRGPDAHDGALVWFADRFPGALPATAVVSAPAEAWRVAGVLWVLAVLVQLLPLGRLLLSALSRGGWVRPMGPPPAPRPPDAAAPPTPPAAG